MDLTDSQKSTIGEWVSEGLKLSEIQSRIDEAFEISLTYMEARFLIEDLELELKDQPKTVDSDLRNTPPPIEPEISEQPVGEVAQIENNEGSASVSLHKIYKPGSVVSGSVDFSDGEKAEWSLDQMGRLALNPGTEAYQPSESDLQDFQKKLSILLQNQGHGIFI